MRGLCGGDQVQEAEVEALGALLLVRPVCIAYLAVVLVAGALQEVIQVLGFGQVQQCFELGHFLDGWVDPVEQGASMEAVVLDLESNAVLALRLLCVQASEAVLMFIRNELV